MVPGTAEANESVLAAREIRTVTLNRGGAQPKFTVAGGMPQDDSVWKQVDGTSVVLALMVSSEKGAAYDVRCRDPRMHGEGGTCIRDVTWLVGELEDRGEGVCELLRLPTSTAHDRGGALASARRHVALLLALLRPMVSLLTADAKPCMSP